MDEATRGLLLRALATRAGVAPEMLGLQVDAGDPADPMSALIAASFNSAPKAEAESHRVDEMRELEMLREKMDVVAAALGACYLCWGDDAACAVCVGNGVPGAFMPDRALFRTFVAPAIRTLRRATAGELAPRQPINPSINPQRKDEP